MFGMLGVIVMVCGVAAWSCFAAASLTAARLEDESARNAETGGNLQRLTRDIERCRSQDTKSPWSGHAACVSIVYVWSPVMPLSRMGIAEIARAAKTLRLPLHLIKSSELDVRTDAGLQSTSDAHDALSARIIHAGGSIHYPAVLLVRGDVVESAIVGFKSTAAYEQLLRNRLGARVDVRWNAQVVNPALPSATPARVSMSLISEYRLDLAGEPGAYFRHTARWNSVAIEAGGAVRMFDLGNASSRPTPAHIDFIPTPDGRFFATPAREHAGLAFYFAPDIMTRSSANTSPIYIDSSVTDQYPSVGVLSSARNGNETRIVYRVLTSWGERAAFRDYETTVTSDATDGIRPLTHRIIACPDYDLSMPIIAPNGNLLAARDETTASTRIFHLTASGACSPVLDLGLQTGKVSWTSDSRRVAFAVPVGAVRDGSRHLWSGRFDRELNGVFVFDLQELSISRVAHTLDPATLTFPEFVADSAVLILDRARGARGPSLRLYCCI